MPHFWTPLLVCTDNQIYGRLRLCQPFYPKERYVINIRPLFHLIAFSVFYKALKLEWCTPLNLSRQILNCIKNYLLFFTLSPIPKHHIVSRSSASPQSTANQYYDRQLIRSWDGLSKSPSLRLSNLSQSQILELPFANVAWYLIFKCDSEKICGKIPLKNDHGNEGNFNGLINLSNNLQNNFQCVHTSMKVCKIPPPSTTAEKEGKQNTQLMIRCSQPTSALTNAIIF